MVKAILQTKPTANQPGDVWEREADQMADAVLRQRTSPEAAPKKPGQTPPFRRTPVAPPSSEIPASVGTVLESAGQPLETQTRATMESRFGHDFSQVRVHADAQAAKSAQSVNALAYTVGQDIAFGTGRYAPNTQAGQKLLAHELTHVVQQSGQGARSLQRKPPAGEETDINLLPDFEAQVSDSAAILQYNKTRKVTLNVIHPQKKGGRPFAYQYLPPIPSRQYAIIRLVLAPGVSVSDEGFPKKSYISNWDNPSVEIYRVQNTAQVPSQGEPINPGNYVGTSLEPVLNADEIDLLGPVFQVERRPDGVDITHIETRNTLQVTVPFSSGSTRFAYHLVHGNPLGIPGVVLKNSKIIVVMTPDVKVLNIGPSQAPVNLDINLYQVKDASQVPAQGSPIDESAFAGYELRSWKKNTVYSTSETLSMLMVDTVIMSLPIVGQLAAVGMFAYGVYTGHDHWGRPLNETDLVIMGIAAALPFAVAGGVKLAEVASNLGRNTSEMTKILRGIEALDPTEQKKVLEWAKLVRKGKTIPEQEAAAFEQMLVKVDKAAKEAAAQVTRKIEAVDKELAKAKTQLMDKENVKPFDPATDTSNFQNKKEVSKAVEKAFAKDSKYIKPASFEQTKSVANQNKSIQGSDVVKGLKGNTFNPANQAVLDVLGDVFKAQENPQAYGKIVAEVWERAKSIPTARVTETGRSPYTLAMMDMLIERGTQIDVVTDFIFPTDFATQILKPGASYVDLAFVIDIHGISPHMLQFLVVDDALKALQPPSSMKQFLTNLSKVTDSSGNKLGGDIWTLLFDVDFHDTTTKSIRRPESLIPTLKSVLPGIE